MERLDAREEIDKLVGTFFAAFDNRSGASPDLARLLLCFADKAVIARGSDSNVQLFTAAEFALPRIELLTGGNLLDFHESETQSTTQIFGSIASRSSRYRKSGLLNGSPYAGAGTKFFQLVALESGWRISSLAWIDDEA